MSRARKGVQIIRDVKTNPYYILNAFIVSNKTNLIIKVNDDFVFIKNTEFPIWIDILQVVVYQRKTLMKYL